MNEDLQAPGGETNRAREDEPAARTGSLASRPWVPYALGVLLAGYGLWSFALVFAISELRTELRRMEVWQSELHAIEQSAAERALAGDIRLANVDDRLRSLALGVYELEPNPLRIEAGWALGELDALAIEQLNVGLDAGVAARRRLAVVRSLGNAIERASGSAVSALDSRTDALYGFLGGTLVLSLTILLQAIGASRRGDELMALHVRLASRVEAIRAAQAQLALSEERYELASRGSNDGMWDWNVSAGTVYFSDRWAELVGFHADRLAAEPSEWIGRVHPDDAGPLRDALDLYLDAPEGIFQHEHRLLRRDGVYVVALARGIAVRGDDGRTIRFVGSHTDVTQARELDRMKRQFLSTMSHELRTPLTSILGSLGLVRGGAVPGVTDTSRALVDVAYDNSTRLLRLINEILDFERLESGAAAFDRTPVDVVALVEHVSDTLRADAAAADLEIAVECDADEVWVEGDSERLGGVITRLVGNATQHAPRRSTVRVVVHDDGDDVVISVRDAGPGVPPDQATRIFESFAQADNSDARRVDGAGLGLAVCRLIVAAHGGSIGYVRDGETVFSVTLPTLASPGRSSDVVAS